MRGGSTKVATTDAEQMALCRSRMRGGSTGFDSASYAARAECFTWNTATLGTSFDEGRSCQGSLPTKAMVVL